MTHSNNLAEQMGVGSADDDRHDPYIAAHHTCTDGGPCLPCAAWDERLIEIEARERARGRTR